MEILKNNYSKYSLKKITQSNNSSKKYMAANKYFETPIIDMLQIINTVHVPSRPKQDNKEHIVCTIMALKSENDMEMETEREKPRSESELTDRTSEEDYLALMKSNY
jgi:hypothetical protein